MLNILGMIILIIIFLIIILLFIGIKISLNYIKNGSELKGCLKILIFNKIKVYSVDYPKSEDDDDKTDEEDEDKKQRDIKKIFELAKPCFNDLIKFIKSAFNCIEIKKIQNHLIFGMDSYADTGKYIGIIWAVLAIADSMDKSIKLSAEPSFTGSRLDGYGENELKIYPLGLFVPLIRLLLKKDVRKLIKGVWDER